MDKRRLRDKRSGKLPSVSQRLSPWSMDTGLFLGLDSIPTSRTASQLHCAQCLHGELSSDGKKSSGPAVTPAAAVHTRALSLW